MLHLIGSIVVFSACRAPSAPIPSAPIPSAPVDDASSSLEEVATTTAQILSRKSAGALTTSNPLTVHLRHSLAEDGDPEGIEAQVLDDAAAVSAWLASFRQLQACPADFSEPPAGTCRWLNGLSVVGAPQCDDAGCCRFRPDGSDVIPLLHNTVFLDRLCFFDGALARIDLLDGD
ncbi:MAG: hypothetical protein AAFV53_26485 [Myxococcota bacterium]